MSNSSSESYSSDSSSEEPVEGSSSEASDSESPASNDNLTPAERVQRAAAGAINAVSKFWEVCYEEQTDVLTNTLEELAREHNTNDNLRTELSTRKAARVPVKAEIEAANLVAKTARDELTAVMNQLREKNELVERQRERIHEFEQRAKAPRAYTQDRLEVLEAFIKENNLKMPDSYEPAYPGNQLKDLRARIELQDEALKKLNESLNGERSEAEKQKKRAFDALNKVSDLETQLKAAQVELQNEARRTSATQSQLTESRNAGEVLRKRLEEKDGQGAFALDREKELHAKTNLALTEARATSEADRKSKRTTEMLLAQATEEAKALRQRLDPLESSNLKLSQKAAGLEARIGAAKVLLEEGRDAYNTNGDYQVLSMRASEAIRELGVS